MLWFVIAGFALVIVVYLLLPLFRTVDHVWDDRKQQNIQIVREQLSELELSFEQGELDNEQYRSRRDELEQALLLDVSGDAESLSVNNVSTTAWVSAGFLILFVPMAAMAIYMTLGMPNAPLIAQQQAQAPEVPLTADGQPDIELLVTSLHNKLREQPDNAKGWYMLGRSYMMMQRFDNAVEAYEKLHQMQPEEPEVMLLLADALSMSRKGDLAGRPKALIEQALLKVPNHQTGLWLSGMSYEQEGLYQKALARWRVLQPLLKNSPEEQGKVAALIARTEAALLKRNQLPSKQTEAEALNISKGVLKKDNTKKIVEGAAKVTLKVSLSAALLSQVLPEDSVFLYAKAQDGPSMPLAAKRLQVKNLPIIVVLDDSMAMMPQFKLSDFSTFIVGARISKSGDAISQSGDLSGEVDQVSQGDEVAVVIDRILQKSL